MRLVWVEVIFCVCLLAVLAGTVLVCSPSHRLRQFGLIKPGATKTAVISLVGTPTESFTNVLVLLRFGGYEAWAYSRSSSIAEAADVMITGKGFGKRLFLPDTNDYVVVFNSSGVVSKTLKPGAQ